jgi:uncharacterized protein (DUF736 family)
LIKYKNKEILKTKMSETNNKTDWSKRELGALWKKKSATQTYLTGHLSFEDGERISVVVFSNKNKKNENAPDFRIYVSEKAQGSKPVQAVSAVPAKKVVAKTPVKAVVQEEDEDIL